MVKSLTVLFLLFCLVGLAIAQAPSAQDASRSSREDGFYGEPSEGNSQFIYIRVTMAGAIFTVTDGDWIIGDGTVAPPNDWYAFPQNSYQSAGGSYAGYFVPSWINTGAAPYNGTFRWDVPVLWNQGGVALDFFLAVSDVGGWLYESQGSSNRYPASGAGNSGDNFKNAFQVRAVFTPEANTGTWGDAGHGLFKNPKIGTWAWAASEPRLQNTDVVYTTDMLEPHYGADGMTGTMGWSAGTPYPWAEATTFRFNPDGGGTFPPSCTDQGMGLPPNVKVAVPLQLLTPNRTTALYRDLLGVQQVIRLRVWGVPSDAED